MADTARAPATRRNFERDYRLADDLAVSGSADLAFETAVVTFRGAKKAGNLVLTARALEQLIRHSWPAARYPDALPIAQRYFKRRILATHTPYHLSALLRYAHMLATLGRAVESIEVLDNAEALDVNAPLETFAALLSARAFAVSQLGYDDSATEMYRRAADLLRKRDNLNAIAPCINNYAVHARLTGHIGQALLLHAEVTHLVEQARIPWRVQYYLLSHGITCYFAGDLKKASALLDTASARPPCNRQVSIAQATLALLIGCSVGDDRLVASHSNGNAMNDALRSGEPSKIANIAAALYRFYTYTGAFDEARRLLDRVLPVATDPYFGGLLFLMIGKSGDREALDRVAERNATRNHTSQIRHAYDCLFRARHLSLGGETGALHEADRAANAFDYLKWPLHRAAALEIAQRFGESAGIYKSCGAHADAKNVRSRRSRRGRPRQVSGQLTLRQWEVAKLCVTGLRNRDIAARLGVGVTTIEFHVRNIFRELNLTSRYELRDVLPAPSDVAEAERRWAGIRDAPEKDRE